MECYPSAEVLSVYSTVPAHREDVYLHLVSLALFLAGHKVHLLAYDRTHYSLTFFFEIGFQFVITHKKENRRKNFKKRKEK